MGQQIIAKQIIATGKVIFDKPSFYLMDTTTGLLGMEAKRYVRLGLWAQEYLDQTITISLEVEEDAKRRQDENRRLPRTQRTNP